MKWLIAAALWGFIGIGTARAETLLSLSATGTAITLPDEITASLNVQTTAKTAAAAQAGVNKTMAAALAAARALAGVTATTDSYSVSQNDPDNTAQKPGYQASQALELTMPAPGGTPPDAFTNLVGKLQQDGLLLNGLDGQLSATGADEARRLATVDALHKLRTQADAVAATLGETAGGFKTLNVQTNGGGPIMPGLMMMKAAAAPPPQAAPGPVTVQVSVDATILLTPPGP
jgi:uncharacterized protein YggE